MEGYEWPEALRLLQLMQVHRCVGVCREVSILNGDYQERWNVHKLSNNTNTGSTISTLLHDKINPKDCQVLSLGDSGFLQFFRVVSSDYGKPRNSCTSTSGATQKQRLCVPLPLGISRVTVHPWHHRGLGAVSCLWAEYDWHPWFCHPSLNHKSFKWNLPHVSRDIQWCNRKTSILHHQDDFVSMYICVSLSFHDQSTNPSISNAYEKRGLIRALLWH